MMLGQSANLKARKLVGGDAFCTTSSTMVVMVCWTFCESPPRSSSAHKAVRPARPGQLAIGSDAHRKSSIDERFVKSSAPRPRQDIGQREQAG